MLSFSDFEKQWLEEICLNNPTTVELGNRFAAKILRDLHELEPKSSEIIFCDGSGDGGIDAAVFIKSDAIEEIEGDTWILVQSKYGTAYSGGDTIGLEAQKLFATLEGKRNNLSSLSSDLVTRIRNFLQNIGPKDRLEYLFVTNRNPSVDEQEYLNNIRVLGRAKFGDCFDVEFASIETIFKKISEGDETSDASLDLNLKTTVTSSGDILYTGATKLKDIYLFMQTYKSKTGDLDLLYEKMCANFSAIRKK